MYAQFFPSSRFQFDHKQMNFQRCIILGNWMMIITLMVTLGCLYISFVIEQQFSIPVQIAAHITTIVFAGLFKLGYVIRCVGVHGLGHKVF